MSQLETLTDYIDLCILSNRMMFIVITSSAEGMIPSEGFKFGEGKSHLAMAISKSIYERHSPLFDAEEKVKENMGYTKEDVRDMIVRGFDERVLCYVADDFQQWAGKHNSYDKNLRWLTGQLTTKRPNCAIFIATCPDLGELAKCARDLFMFEIKVPVRGYCEIQKIKVKTPFDDPLNPRKRLHYIGETEFPKASPELSEWYDNWREAENKEAFIKGWDERYNKDTKEKHLITQRDFIERARECGIKADDHKFRDLYQGMTFEQEEP
ncbi:unnamed protein product, partial [marine sediment metagenome]